MTDQTPIREQRLNAIDFSYCQSLGYASPEELLAAYDASRTSTADRAALREIAADALATAEGWQWAPGFPKEENPTWQGFLWRADAVLAAVLPATTNHDTDTGADDGSASEDRREQYATPLYALMRQNGWGGERTERVVQEMDLVLNAVIAVADAEMERRTLMLQASRDEVQQLRTDRRAVLREAADIAEAQRQFEPAYGARKSAQVSENVGILRVAVELRRVADETATTETQRPEREQPVYLSTPCAACTHPYNWHCGQPACQFGREGGLCGCRSFTPGEEPAAGARQNGADHVCNSVWARGEMDEPLGYLTCGVCGTRKDGAQR